MLIENAQNEYTDAHTIRFVKREMNGNERMNNAQRHIETKVAREQ